MSKERRPDWFDPRMPDRSRCVLSVLLEEGARRCPDRVLAVFEDGDSWTYSSALEQALSWAAGLAILGVEQGDTVVVWAANSKEAVRSWFAINLLGACFVPINPAFRGKILENALGPVNTI